LISSAILVNVPAKSSASKSSKEEYNSKASSKIYNNTIIVNDVTKFLVRINYGLPLQWPVTAYDLPNFE
jgi:hypothetical protein